MIRLARARPLPSPTALAATLLVAALTAVACGGRQQAAPRADEHVAVALRLLGDEPLPRLDATAFVERRTVFRNRFDARSRKIATWQVSGPHRPVSAGLRHRAGDGEPLVFEHLFLGELGRRLATLGVRLRAEGRASLRLFWAEPGQPYGDERSLHQPVSAGEGWQQVVLELSDHAHWLERIDRLRLEVRGVEGDVVVRRLDVERDVVVAERLSPLLLEPRRVELDGDVRPAVASLPGLSLRHRLRVPASARLRLGFGVLHGGETPVAFEVHVHVDGGERRLWRAVVAREPGRHPTWRRADVGLASLAGREVELELRNPALDEDEVADGAVPGLALWANPEIVAPADDEPPPNLVLVSYDTLRADRMSLYGNPRPTTPHLDRWAAEHGVVFERAVAASPWTLPSHTSLFTGLEAFRHGAELDLAAPPELEMLAERLRRRGYRTLAVTGGGYLSPDYGLDQGFDRFRYWTGDRSRVPAEAAASSDLSAWELELGLERALGWLDEHADLPFFLFLHTYELHKRSRSREPWFSRWSAHAGTDLEVSLRKPEPRLEQGFLRRRELRVTPPGGEPVPVPPRLAELPYDLYDSCLAYADERWAELLEHLEHLDLARRTLVVFTSDHGEMLGEHGLAGHLYLYDDNVLVPLVMAGPGLPAGRRVGRQVRSIDVVPTLLELLGLPPAPGLDGRSLLPLLTDPSASFPAEAWTWVASGNHGAALRLRDRYKYTFRDAVFPPLWGRERVFDLERDPGETAPLADPEQAAEWRRHLRRTLADGLAGLRLRFRAGDEPLAVTVEGPAVRRSSVKSVDLAEPPSSRVRWAGSGRVAVEVPAGRAFELALVAVRGTEPPLHVEHAGRRVFTLDPEHLSALATTPLRLSFDGATWTPRTPPPPGDTFVGLELRWRGPAAGTTEAPEAANDELRRQLEALGYL